MLHLREKKVEIEIFNLASGFKAKIDNACQKYKAFKSKALNGYFVYNSIVLRGWT